MATRIRTRPGALLTHARRLLSPLDRIILITASTHAHSATRGLAEMVRRGCAFKQARWIRLRDDQLLPIRPTSIDSYPDGRRILHFTVIAALARR
jgi:hypothetical protein